VTLQHDVTGKYRILGGVHRWSAYKATRVTEAEVIIKNLDEVDPLLYAAKKAIGPRQLTEDAGQCSVISGQSSITMGLDIKIFRMRCLGIPQDRIAKRLDLPQKTISNHLAKMPVLANPLNSDSEKDFTVARVAEKVKNLLRQKQITIVDLCSY